MVHPKNDSSSFLFYQGTFNLSSLFPLGNAKYLILNTFYVQNSFKNLKIVLIPFFG